MKIKILLGALMFLLFSATADAQHYRHHGGHRGGYSRGYHRRPGVVVVTPPGPRVVVRRGGYGPRHRGYYGRGYRRGYYGGRPHRGYYRHGRRY